MSKKKKNRAADNAALAETYACDVRTIARWRRERAPIDELDRMRVWLAGRKNIPPGTLAKLLAERKQERAEAAPIEPGSIGAPHVLARLEQAEARASRDLQTAEASNDVVAIRAATTRYLSVARELLRYDVAIQTARRDSGAMVSRESMERILFGLGWHIVTAYRVGLQHLPPLMTAIDDPRELGSILTGALNRIDVSAQSAMAEQYQVPGWALKALVHGFTSEPGADESVEKHRAAFRTWVAALVNHHASQALVLIEKRNAALTRWRSAKNEEESKRIWDEECRPLGL